MSSSRLSVFTTRFNLLIGDRTQAEFARLYGFNKATVAAYASGQRVPDAVMLRDIAERCGVSADWLLGVHHARQAGQPLEDDPIYSNFRSRYGSHFSSALHNIDDSCSAAYRAAETVNPEAPPFERYSHIQDAISRIELALYHFSELSREIPYGIGLDVDEALDLLLSKQQEVFQEVEDDGND